MPSFHIISFNKHSNFESHLGHLPPIVVGDYTVDDAHAVEVGYDSSTAVLVGVIGPQHACVLHEGSWRRNMILRFLYVPNQGGQIEYSIGNCCRHLHFANVKIANITCSRIEYMFVKYNL